MKLTDEEIGFVVDQDIVYENLIRDGVKPVFSDFESYLRTKSVSQEKILLFLKVYFSRFDISELQPGVYEVIDTIKTTKCQISPLLILSQLRNHKTSTQF